MYNNVFMRVSGLFCDKRVTNRSHLFCLISYYICQLKAIKNFPELSLHVFIHIVIDTRIYTCYNNIIERGDT